jgi:polysaccharide deacetylase family protein (PEP-CTERM system associated)
MHHAMIHRLGSSEFREELLTSAKLLGDLTGQAVIGYRAPTFSITHATAWAIDVLADAGYQYDCSVFPVRHDRYGVPDAPRYAHRAVGPAGGTVVEIPPLTLRLLRMNLPVGGGGYLRLLPIHVLGAALRRCQRAGRRGMVYLHPWEFDPDQPPLPMGRLGRWRHRVNLHRTERKLAWLLGRFRFGNVRQQLPRIQQRLAPSWRYGLNGRG